jgi:hypothetical protein
MRSLLYSIVLAVSVTAAGSSDAQAWWGGWGGGYGYYNVYSQDYVPYYAMHPPVYYSYPVPRTYGYSPFAYPPGTRTPDYVPGLPIEIINPHVRSSEPAKAVSTSDKTAVVPQVLINPYVVGSMKTASSASADVETDAR